MTTRSLRLAKDLTLPLDAVTQTFLIVGKRGSGKSNTAARFVEQLHHAKLPFVVLDPVDTWWGLKAARHGGKGLDVYVFGGKHADLPLEAGGGALIAEVLCEHRMPMVLSVKHLSGGERSRFMVAFAHTLFQKWGGGPLHVVLEEAHELAPQMSGGRSGRDQEQGEAAMLGAFKRLWKLGRSSGIGGTAVTQRPASLSKDITTQSEILIAHRTIGPQDVKAIGEWVKYHGEREDILAELPTLPTGEAFVWAPEFPEGNAIGLQRSTILLRETYDSASTPKVGEQRVEPKELAPVDLERLRSKMAATIEKAKADDPRELRKQIADLSATLKKSTETGSAKTAHTKVVETKVLTDADRALLDGLNSRLTSFRDAIGVRQVELFEAFKNDLIVQLGDFSAALQLAGRRACAEFEGRLESKGFQKILGKLATVPPAPTPTYPTTRRVTPAQPVGTPGGSRSTARPAAGGDPALAPGERKILTAVAQFGEVDRGQLTVLVGYKATARDTYISRLAQKHFVESGNGRVRVTDEGIAALGADYEPLPTGAALLDFWRGRLAPGECKVLDAVVAAYPQPIARDAIGEHTGYRPTARDTYISRLASRRLVQSNGRGLVLASAELF